MFVLWVHTPLFLTLSHLVLSLCILRCGHVHVCKTWVCVIHYISFILSIQHLCSMIFYVMSVLCCVFGQAEAIWAAISDRVKMLTDQGENTGRLHRNASNNMSWSTRKAENSGKRDKKWRHSDGSRSSAGVTGTMLASSIPMQVFTRVLFFMVYD